jgi:hypothetical protein
MERPPRDTKRERLVDGKLLRYSYLIAGTRGRGEGGGWWCCVCVEFRRGWVGQADFLLPACAQML